MSVSDNGDYAGAPSSSGGFEDIDEGYAATPDGDKAKREAYAVGRGVDPDSVEPGGISRLARRLQKGEVVIAGPERTVADLVITEAGFNGVAVQRVTEQVARHAARRNNPRNKSL